MALSTIFAALMTVAATQDTAGRWAPLARILEDGIGARAFPGAVVAVGRRDTVLYLRAFGHLDYSRRQAVTTRTVYDVASLTKVVGLTTAVMMLVDEGRVELDAPVRSYVQMFGYAHDESITVRHLLTHSSGLPAWQPMFRTAHSREDIFDVAARAPLEYPTGERTVYSDLGAIVLTRMVEVLTGEGIDRFLARRLFTPLGMRDTRFNPPRSWRNRIAPTEVDNAWRGRLVHGEVHDENAAAMGGVSGHAGMFSTGENLVQFAQLMLRAGPDAVGEPPREPSPLLRWDTVAEFTRVQRPDFASRALGWDTPDGRNSAGSRLSARAYGHTGFTGTSLWIDPAQDLFVILLTNRVHPSRENPRIQEVRRAVADAAVEAALSARGRAAPEGPS